MTEQLKSECKKTYPDYTLIKKLITQGATIGSENISEFYHYQTPLQMLITKFRPCVEIIRFMLKSNKVKVIPKKINIFHLAVVVDNYELVKVMITERPNLINSKTEKLFTPLSLAIINKSITIIKLLVDNKADLESFDIDGDNPLMTASKAGCLERVKILIEGGANINAKNRYGNPLISFMISRKDYDTIKLFIEKGVDLTVKDKFNNTITIDENVKYLISTFKTCILCRIKSCKFNLIYITYQCPICLQDVDKIYAFECGHLNCCEECFTLKIAL